MSHEDEMKILITGAGGFLGTEIVRQFVSQKNIQIIAFSTQKRKIERLIDNTKNFSVFDRNAIFDMDAVLSNVDVLINCAFPRNVDGIQMADGLRYISKLLETAVAGGVKSVINISSQSVYSQFRMEPATEDTELNLESKYAVGKYATELMTNSICGSIPHTNIRMASLIGIGFDQRLVNQFVKQVLAGNNICIKGGKQLFGFLDVRDAASAIIAVAGGKNWKEVYNLGPEKSFSLLEIANCVQETINDAGYAKTEIELFETDDWQNSGLNSMAFKMQFGWRERYRLEDTIVSIVKYLRL